MKVQEAIKNIKALNAVCWQKDFYDEEFARALALAIKSLEMQDKLKQWIENYKNHEFKDVTITRDNLIDILNEFILESEKPMKEVTVVMNVPQDSEV